MSITSKKTNAKWKVSDRLEIDACYSNFQVANHRERLGKDSALSLKTLKKMTQDDFLKESDIFISFDHIPSLHLLNVIFWSIIYELVFFSG